MRVLPALLICVILATSASAAETIGLYGRDYQAGGEFRRYFFANSSIVEIAAILETDHDFTAGEFVMTDLAQTVPGVIRLGTVRVNDTDLDLGDNERGEYLLAAEACMPAGRIEMVRVTYGLTDGVVLGVDRALFVRGFETGDSQPSSFYGSPGYVDCQIVQHVLAREAWSEYMHPDNPTLAGAVVINPSNIPVGGEVTSLGLLKAAFAD